VDLEVRGRSLGVSNEVLDGAAEKLKLVQTDEDPNYYRKASAIYFVGQYKMYPLYGCSSVSHWKGINP
jgi:hypothetical protein